MPHLIGARDLGLDVSWEFGFVENGSRAATTPGVVYLDVGGYAAPGILDHHAASGDGSTAHVLLDRADLAYNHLLGPWLTQHERGQIASGTRWTPRLITHYRPDWDSVVAAHLLMRLVMDGEFPAYAHALAAYASLVDHGRSRVDLTFPESLLCPHFAHAVTGERQLVSDAELMTSGLALLDRVLDDLRAAYGPRPTWQRDLFLVRRDNLAPSRWRDDERFASQAEFLLAEPARFATARAQGQVIVAPLPAADGAEAVPVPIFVSHTALTSPLADYFLRAEGIPALVRPLSTSIRGTESTSAATFPRVKVTVDPDGYTTGGRRLNLRGLGYALERAERRWRTQDGRTDPRGGPPRWDDGSCVVADPWYDGRGHAYTILDSPRAGTELPYAEIVRIVTETAFWERPIRAGKVIDLWLAPDFTREPRRGLPQFDAIADPLRVLYSDSDASRQTIDMPDDPDRDVRTWHGRRRYPVGTAVEYDVLECESDRETTLEALTRAVQRRRATLHPDAPPHRTLIWLQLLPCGSHTRPVAELIRPLHSGELTETLLHGTPAWQNATTVVMVPEVVDPVTVAAIQEIFCYGAFVADTLSTMSRRVTEVLPGNDREIDALGLRNLQRDALRFQARYYQLDVTRDPVAMALATTQRSQTGIEAHLTENLAELDQLSMIAQVASAEREARADRRVQWALSAVALLSIVQTAAGMLTLGPGQISHPVMVGSYTLALVIFLFLVLRSH
jgi:hypothetical protein